MVPPLASRPFRSVLKWQALATLLIAAGSYALAGTNGALWLVLTTYKSVTLPAFFAAFLITVLLFRVALLVRD